MSQKRELVTYGMWSISYKSKSEDDYLKMEEKVIAEQPQITLSRYYGTDWMDWSIESK